MKYIKCTILFLLLGLWGSIQAQDIHFTLYNMSPLTLNPALTGAYNGTVRIGGIYRDQATTLPNGYTTPLIYVDAPILNVGKKDWIGVGGNIYNDQAGAGALTNTGAFLSGAFHKALNKKGTSLFSFGLQGGMVQRRLDLNKMNADGFVLKFGDELVAGATPGSSFDRMNNRISDNISYFDLNAGVMLTAQVNKQTDLHIGMSLYHILKPNYALIKGNANSVNTDSSTVKLPRKFQLHGQFNFDLNKKWTLSPGFLFHQIRSANEMQVQAMLGYTLSKEKNMVFKFGPGYRMGDAAQFLFGLDMKDLKVAASYDWTLSGMSDINDGVGGFEIAASYIIKIFKAPTVKPVIFCPRF